jgi:hypothetical protein
MPIIIGGPERQSCAHRAGPSTRGAISGPNRVERVAGGLRGLSLAFKEEEVWQTKTWESA